MNYYQAEHGNDNWIPNTLYRKVLAVIADYKRMKQTLADIREEGKSLSDLDGMPHGNNISNPTEEKAIRIAEKYSAEIRAVEMGRTYTMMEFGIPSSYIDVIEANITDRAAYPDYGSIKDWKKWKRKYIAWVAHFLDEI